MAIITGLLVFFTCLVSSVSGAKLLLMPVYHHSHVNMFLVAGKALQKAGIQHRVYMRTSIHVWEKSFNAVRPVSCMHVIGDHT